MKKTETKLKKFTVSIMRTSYSKIREIEVEALNEEFAKDKALEGAGGEIFYEGSDPDYTVEGIKETEVKPVYYDVHVFHSRHDGFSVPVKSEAGELDDDAIIDLALEQGLMNTEEARSVDYVEELTEQEYNNMKRA
jgi:hypothetical protein